MKTFCMYNPKTGKTVRKTQQTEPRLRGYVCVDSSPVMPDRLPDGRCKYEGPNGHYYARPMEDGSHYQP